MSEAKRCEAKECGCCGTKECVFRAWGPSGAHSDLYGTPLCVTCFDGISDDECASRIRARRSAQPAVASGPLSADGRPIALGDRVGWYDGDQGFVGTVESLSGPVSGEVKVIRDEHDRQYEFAPAWWASPKHLRHLAPIAAPPGGEKDTTIQTPAQQEVKVSEVRTASTMPPVGAGPSLAAFTAAVHEHLLPRLPKGFKAITDVVHGRRFALWVLDENGGEVWERDYRGDELPSAVVLASGAVDVACEIMHRMSRAAEKPRGGGR